MDMDASLIERRTMHVSAVHRLPRRADVVREQLASVGLSLRREAAVVAGLVAIFTALVLWDFVLRPYGARFDLEPGLLVPMLVLALLAPMAVWKGEGPERRAYHHSMPVELGQHAVARSLAGLLWLVAAGGGYVAWMAAMTLVTGGTTRFSSGLEWAGPLAGALVLYFVGSAVTLRSAHPWRWVGGGAVACAFLASMDEPRYGRTSLLETWGAVLNGRFGFLTVATGLTPVPMTETFAKQNGEIGHYTVINSLPITGSWAVATWIWLAAAVALFVWAAYRQPER